LVNVCFAPKSGASTAIAECPLSAINGHGVIYSERGSMNVLELKNRCTCTIRILAASLDLNEIKPVSWRTFGPPQRPE
ncbi:MAG: hypothetical protein WA884_05815, partial [Methyloceanibacter sp.]